MTDMTTILIEHEARIRAIDPQAGVPQIPDDLVETITVENESGAGFAAIRQVAVDPTSSTALWSPPHPWGASLRICGDSPGAVAAELLDGVDRFVSSVVPRGDTDHAVMVRVAARDTELVKPLLRHGYAAGTVTALRAGIENLAPAQVAGVHIRSATTTDRDRILELVAALATFDGHFGTLGYPVDSLVQEFADSLLAGPPGLLLVAESEAALVGFASLSDPGSAAWAARSTTLSPVAYLGQAFVDPAHRGAGVGAALTARLHAIAAEREWGAILLDYTAPNPWSGPFWSRMGYRPLYVAWQRRPAHPSWP